jgi:ribokinase
VICTLGDLLLDVIVRLDGPIAEDTDTYGHTRVGLGGQAANVAAWVVALGGEARFIGKTARDPAGRMLTGELRSRGVEVAGPQAGEGTGTVVSLARSDGRRTMLTDRGVAPDLAVSDLEPDWFTSSEWLHVPAYSLVRSPIRDAALAAVAFVRDRGGSVSVDLSATSALAQAAGPPFDELLAALAPDLVLGTEAELDLVGQLRAPTVVSKRGSRGCSVRRSDELVELPAHPTEVIDTTGAGDAFAAGFLLAGAELGLEAAARCVGTMGAMP